MLKTDNNSNSISLIVGQFIRLMKLIQPFWPHLFRSIKISAITGIIALLLPYTSKLLIDEVYPSQNVTLMHIIVIGTLVISISNMLMGTLRSYYTTYISSIMGGTLSLMFFNHLQYLPITFYEEHRVGEITSRFGDVRSSLNSASQILSNILMNTWYLTLVPPVLFLLQWKLAVASLILIPVSAVITFFSGKVLRRLWKKSAEAAAEVNAIQVEALSQIRILKSMAAERLMFKRARDSVKSALHAQFHAVGTSHLFGISTGFLSILNTAIYTWFGWTLIFSRQMTLGEYIAFSGYIGYLYGPILNLVGLFNDVQQTSVSLNRMFEYLNIKPEQSPLTAYEVNSTIENKVYIKGGVEFSHISFSYEPHKPVLKDISFTVCAGSVFCIFGPSGSGKTTITRLLTRFNDPTAGKILIDGIPINEIPLYDLRRHISVVMQEIGLVRGTVWDNLILACENPSKTVVEEAVRICHLDKMITEMPYGFETPIAEWGASISGGQRQRLAIARALVRNTPILILDEATSNLDVLTELEILKELIMYWQGRTIVLITHRIGSTALADKICVMDAGQIIGIDDHQNLLKNNSLYYQMYKIATADSKDCSHSVRTKISM
ncbi:MAG: peptidase domain-containing ABC transporter [Ignavibacteriales bacterium]|nr:peptidase domain-containing ABC transporter [Ignavibacteriales bacterium]